MKTIILLHGNQAFVDDEDVEHVLGYTWRLNSRGYVVHDGSRGKNKTIFLHKQIANRAGILQNNKEVDHINRDKLESNGINEQDAVLLAALYHVPKKFFLKVQKNYDEIIRALNQQP